MNRSQRIALLAALALLAAACTTGEEITPPPTTGEARAGGALAVGITEPTSVDPASAADRTAALVVSTMCDPLIESDPATGELTPAIAESWQVSDAGRHLTVKLRKGVRFHNGQELTAEDVVFSLSRVASDETASPLAGLLQPIRGYAQVHGEADAADERWRETLQGARVIENYSFELSLREPLADFVRLLSHPLASPVPKEAAQSDPVAFARQPLCAGPYRMAEPWERGQDTIRLSRFDDYQPVNEGYTAAGRGYADDIEFKVLPEPDAHLDAFRAGAVHTARLSRSAVPDADGLDGEVMQAPGPHLEYIGLPTERDPFDDPKVRRALNQVLDRQHVVATAFHGAALPASGFLPPTLGAVHREEACGAAAPVAGDVEAVRAALADAGVDLEGASVQLLFNDELGHRAVVEEVARQWEAAFGLEVTLVPRGWEDHLAGGQGPRGYDHPFRLGWAGEYHSADRYLAPLFHSDSLGSTNVTGFRSAEFDRVLERVARRATSVEERRLDYQQLEDVVCEQMPLVPVAFPTVNHLISDRMASARRDGSVIDLASGDLLVRELYRTQDEQR